MVDTTHNRTTAPLAQGVDWTGRPVWAEINLDAVSENVRRLKRWVGPGCAVMAVVKADAYGLGAAPIAEAARTGGATWLGVACVDEGVALREAGVPGPILVLGPVAPAEVSKVIAERLTITLNTREVALALSALALQCRVQVAVHLKVDTGLGRYGRRPDELLGLAEMVAGLPNLRIEGLYTHFADVDDLAYTNRQLDVFTATRRRLEEHGLRPPILHAAASDATLQLPESHFDLVRVGIMLSGHYPSPGGRHSVVLEPALTVRARLARVHPIGPGATVGYGRTYQAPGPRTIALVPMGYADGYHRVLSGRAQVLVGGRRCPVVGRISMDQLTVDVSAVPGVREGDPVVLIGRQGGEQITLDELAAAAGTISYELLSHLAPRLPRVYLRDGQVVQIRTLLGSEDVSTLVRD
jgi:alanine racemase